MPSQAPINALTIDVEDFFQVSARVRPVRPVRCSVIGSSVVKNPVATTRTSIGRSTPSAVAMPVGVTRAIGSVTSSTLSEATAG